MPLCGQPPLGFHLYPHFLVPRPNWWPSTGIAVQGQGSGLRADVGQRQGQGSGLPSPLPHGQSDAMAEMFFGGVP